METLFGLFFLFCIFGLPKIINEQTACRRLPPSGYKIDHGAINRDLANGASKDQVFRNINNGKYDIWDKK